MNHIDNRLDLGSTLPALTVAPLAALSVLFYAKLLESDFWGSVLVVALYMTPVVYVATAAVVLPVLAIFPSLRRPGYTIAFTLGALSAWCAFIGLNGGYDVGPLFFASRGLPSEWLEARQEFFTRI